VRLVLLLLACSRIDAQWVGEYQECWTRIESPGSSNVDVLFVIKGSAAGLAQAIDDQLQIGGTWYHLAVVGSAGACGVDGAFVNYLAGAINDVDPGITIGEAVGCLAAGADRAVTATDWMANDRSGFLRPDSWFQVVNVADTITREEIFGDLFYWGGDAWASCVRPRDPAHPTFIVEDVRNRDDSVVATVPACADDGWQPSCWEILDDAKCPPGSLRFNVRRPPWGAPEGIHTRAVYDCALLPESR
jgi:hypothetical protein